MYKIHSYLVYCLVGALVSQGFLLNTRILGIPIWVMTVLLFIPFINNYAKLTLNLRNLNLKQTYYYLFTLTIVLSMINLYTESYKRVLIIILGTFIATILFYEYRNNINKFIKLIIILILLESIFSIFQFHSDIVFFEEFKRKALIFDNGSWVLKIWDVGSSGLFGYPVPYGYFMGTFIPIVYPFVVSFFGRSVLKNVYIALLSLIGFYGFLLSMQRAALIASIVSIFVINIFILRRDLNLIIMTIMIFLIIAFFAFFGSGKELLSLDLTIDRLSNQHNWIINSDTPVYGNGNQKASPHMYIYNTFSYYGFFGVVLILLFYITLLRTLIKHNKYCNMVVPNGAMVGLIMSIISYGLISLFHNNGHFAYDVVGFISFGYVFSMVYFVSRKKYYSLNSIKVKES
jgi:hypothetical protein